MGWQIGSHPAATPTSQVGAYYNDHRNLVTTILVVLVVTLLTMPLAAIGMAVSWVVWRVVRPSLLTASALAVSGAITVLALNERVAWLWPWGAVIPGRLFGILPVSSATGGGGTLWASACIEVCAGPLLLLALDGLFVVQGRTLSGGLMHQAERKRAEAGQNGQNPHLKEPGPYDFRMAQQVADSSHPPGGIRLGVEKDNRRRPFDVTMQELALHTFLPGTTGSGKTTTLERLADGAMSNGSGFIVIDCKGGSLGGTAKRLATRHGLPFVVVDPHDPNTVGYEPCTGSPSDIANKLIGSFAFGEGGEIYKQIAMHVVPLVVSGLVAAGMPVTLKTIAGACDLNGLRVLARKVENGSKGTKEEREELSDELSNLLDESDAAGKNGVLSLKHRFGAVLQGEFKPLFAQKKNLDWDAVLKTPTVVYVSLPVTAASEDVELLGRILIQDIKQVCSRRLRAVAQHPEVPLVPTLVAIDEFAALKDAKQIIDLLLQARQAALPLVLATQYFPQDPDLKKAVMQAGLIIVHRLVAEDAEPMAAQFGTRAEWKVTYQTDWETGGTQKGSIRDVQGYVVHPNILRDMPVGQAAIRSVQSNRTQTVAIFPVTG